MAFFAECRETWLRTFLELPGGAPCADTFRRVFESIRPDAFAMILDPLLRQVAGDLEGRVVAIDGKTLRRSHDRKKGASALHVLTAYVADCGITLSALATDEKSNEITMIPELLGSLDLEGAIVTLDAMGCQKAIADKILERKANYVLALKDNHPKLRERVERLFADDRARQRSAIQLHVRTTEARAHGRGERRTVSVLTGIDLLDEAEKWSGLTTAIEVVYERTGAEGATVETRTYLASFIASAQRMGEIIREHWQIENGLHWVLDVTFQEDQSRIRSRTGATNLATLRRLALTLLKLEPTQTKRSIAQRRKRISWDPDYGLRVLSMIHAV
jgi:predicted transposase YbfD/YdcC